MCVVEKGAKKCKKCTKDKCSCYWDGTLSTNKGKAPQKAPAPKRLVPMVKIKITCPQKATKKAGKSHIIPFLLWTDLHPLLEVFHSLQALTSHMAYHLWLPPSMLCIHPVFYVVKLMPVPKDPIGWWVCPPPALTVIGGEQHYEVESILDSRLRARKLGWIGELEGLWVWGDLLSEQMWHQCIMTDFSSLTITLVHLVAFVWFTLPVWTSVPIYQHHDFAAVKSMHPWRGGDVRGTLKFQYSDFVTHVTLCNSCNSVWLST